MNTGNVLNKKYYSDFLTPERLEAEEGNTRYGEHNRTMARLITETHDKDNIKDIIECGCGTGWLTFYLFNTYKLKNIKYFGFDKNHLSIERCFIKRPQIENKELQFAVEDIRDFVNTKNQADLVCALNFFKHISIIEWETIFSGFMKLGKKYAIFSMNVNLNSSHDEGILYPHLWLKYSTLIDNISKEGYQLVKYVPFSYWALEGTWIDYKSAGIFVCKRTNN